MRRRELRIQDAVRDAIRVTHPEARRKIWRAIDTLRDDPFEGRALRERLVGLWRFPVGRLRIVYRFDADRFEVVAVAPRVTVYEDLVRSLGERRARYRRGLHRAAVARRSAVDEGSVLDDARRLRHAQQQEQALERQLTAPRSARERAESRQWSSIRRTSASRRLGRAQPGQRAVLRGDHDHRP